MAKELEIVSKKEVVSFGLDNIVIAKYISGIKGGRVLDVEGFSEKVIKAGHVIIKNANGDYAPMPVKDGAYGVLPEGAKYAGILTHSMSAEKPSASVMYNGEVNEVASPYPVEGIKEAFLKDCPHIVFISDVM